MSQNFCQFWRFSELINYYPINVPRVFRLRSPSIMDMCISLCATDWLLVHCSANLRGIVKLNYFSCSPHAINCSTHWWVVNLFQSAIYCMNKARLGRPLIWSSLRNLTFRSVCVCLSPIECDSSDLQVVGHTVHFSILVVYHFLGPASERSLSSRYGLSPSPSIIMMAQGVINAVDYIWLSP